MTIENFLSFWSHNNTVIIESLAALIILSSLFLAFRSFFSKKNKVDLHANSVEIDTSQIEKTLQKILENQGKLGSTGGGSPGLNSGEQAGEGASEVNSELSQLRSTLTDTHKTVEELKAQLAEARQKVQAAEAAVVAGGTSGQGAAGGEASKELGDLNDKIRDLEARLAEYEIISEDIADLSKYREENEQLRKELASIRGEPVTPSSAAPAPKAETTEQQEETFASEAGDEDLMKDFAAEAEGQKAAAATEVPEGAADAKPPSATPPNDDNQKLMNEFETFVAKKS